MKQSAGTLLYRSGPDGLEVLLVHPSGGYNRRAPWSIPKGMPNEGESNLEVTARRETLEETAVAVTGPLVSLGSIIYRKSRKQVHCFGGPAPEDAQPRCASWEVDQACFVALRGPASCCTPIRCRSSTDWRRTWPAARRHSRSMRRVCSWRKTSHSARVKTPGVVPMARTQLAPRALATRRHSVASRPRSSP